MIGEDHKADAGTERVLCYAVLPAPGLHEDALREYSELEACYADHLQQVEARAAAAAAAAAAAVQAAGGAAAAAPALLPPQQQQQPFGGPAPGEDEAAHMWASWQDIRQAVQASEALSQFAIRQFLFASKARVLLKLHRPAEVGDPALIDPQRARPHPACLGRRLLRVLCGRPAAALRSLADLPPMLSGRPRVCRSLTTAAGSSLSLAASSRGGSTPATCRRSCARPGASPRRRRWRRRRPACTPSAWSPTASRRRAGARGRPPSRELGWCRSWCSAAAVRALQCFSAVSKAQSSVGRLPSLRSPPHPSGCAAGAGARSCRRGRPRRAAAARSRPAAPSPPAPPPRAARPACGARRAAAGTTWTLIWMPPGAGPRWTGSWGRPGI